MMIALDTTRLSVGELLTCFADVLDELKVRGVVRTRNNPVADYAEWLVSQRMGFTISTGNTKGHDAVDSEGRRYQIKGRRLDATHTSRQLSPIRNLDNAEFDFLIAVLFDRDFKVIEAYQIPHAVIGAHARFSSHVNGHILSARGGILEAPAVEDITKSLQP